MNSKSRYVMSTVFIIVSCLCMAETTYAQELAFKIGGKRATVEKNDDKVPLIEILDKIELNHNVSFAYQKKFLSGKLAVYQPLMNEDFEPYLEQILRENRLTFKRIENINERIYIISPMYPTNLPADSAKANNIARHVFDSPSERIYGSVKGASDGIPLPGVNVRLKDTNQGTTTDRDGNFSIEVPAGKNHIMIFSYVGFSTKQLPFEKTARMDVVLQEDTQSLAEVVITALGINRQQKSLGYAVSTIGGEDLTAAGNFNVASAMYGKASGVRIRTAPGGATSAVTMQVRGINSLNYNAQPLYVINGVMMRDANERGAAGVNNDDYFKDTRIRGNGILDINPSDIEAITILKGASATALYGSDAASGAVIITTKNGSRKSGVGVDINYQLVQEEVAFTPRYQNIYGPGYDRARNLATGASEEGWVSVDVDGNGSMDGYRPLFESYAQFGPKMEGQEVLWWDGSVRPFSAQPDNYKDFHRKGYGSVFNIALANQIGKWSYRFSYTRSDYAGVQVGGKLARNIVNLNSTVNLSKRLRADLAVNYSNSFVHNRPLKLNRLLSSWNGFFSRAENASLFFEKYKTQAGYKWVPFDQAQRNPDEALKFTTPRGYEVMNMLWQQLTNSEDETQDRVISSLTVNYDIVKNLTLRGRLGNDFTKSTTETRQYNEYPTEFNGANSTGAYGTGHGNYQVFYSDVLLSYNRKLRDRFHLSVNGGFQLRDEKYADKTVSTSGGLVQENWFNLSNSYSLPLSVVQMNSRILKYAFFGIVNMNYRNFLYLEGTSRQEYSSTLPPGKSSYFYPSVNSGFVFSEAFKLPRVISYGKVRASYGIVGNAPPAYESNIVYNLNHLQTSNGAVISATSNGNLFGNNSIRPERKHEIEFGLETRMFRNKVAFDIAYYWSRTFDQILKLDIPSSAGSDRILTNVGALDSRGLEIALTGTILSKPLTWNTGVNVAFNATTLHALVPGVDQLVFKDLEGGSIRVVAEKRQPIGNIYVYPRKTDDAGNFMINNNGLYIIDHSRYVKAGNLLPNVTGGFLNDLHYKGFSLQFNCDFSFGGQIISPALKYGMGSGLYESTLKYRSAATGGLSYYIDGSGNKILLQDQQGGRPDNTKVYHDGIVLQGVREDGSINTTVIDAATYYMNTFDWGNNAWNEEGAIYDNSYIKLREVVFSYQLPKTLTDKLHFQSVRLSLIGRNLLYVWKTLENLDPESTIGTNWLNQGIDDGAGAATRSYGFSVNLSF